MLKLTQTNRTVGSFSIRHPSLVEALRHTLAELEKSEELDPADPALVELKNSILRTIGELELKKMERSGAA
jgi:hypothetical protein